MAQAVLGTRGQIGVAGSMPLTHPLEELQSSLTEMKAYRLHLHNLISEDPTEQCPDLQEHRAAIKELDELIGQTEHDLADLRRGKLSEKAAVPLDDFATENIKAASIDQAKQSFDKEIQVDEA